MFKIIQISYQRVFNLGNFEAERIELVASLDDDEQTERMIENVFAMLKAKVHELHEMEE